VQRLYCPFFCLNIRPWIGAFDPRLLGRGGGLTGGLSGLGSSIGLGGLSGGSTGDSPGLGSSMGFGGLPGGSTGGLSSG